MVVATFHVKVTQKIQQEFSSLDSGEGERRKNVQYIPELIERVIMLHETGETLLSENIIPSPDDSQNIFPSIAPLPPLATADIVTTFESRFEK